MVAEHQDLCVLGGIVHPEDPEQFGDAADPAVEEAERHGRKRRRTRPAWSRRRSSKWTLQDRTTHPWQQTVGPSSRFVEMAARPGEMVLDPFLGSGTTGLAGPRRRFLGCDVDRGVVSLALDTQGAADCVPGLRVAGPHASRSLAAISVSFGLVGHGEVLVDALLGTLKECAARIDDFRSHHTQLGEENTKAALIEPVLKALGWDTSNPDEVHHEYRRLSNDNPVDYALLLLRTPRLFLEAKDLWANLADPKWSIQFISYATAAGVQWVVLTNGAEWRVYNAHAPVPIEQKLFRTVRIDEDLDSAYSVLELLSKDNMRELRIEELWKGFFIDRKVHAALTKLFSGSEPAKEIVSAVRHRDPDLKLSEIRESLARVRVVFDFPAPFVAPGPISPAKHKPAAVIPGLDDAHVQESERARSVKKLLDMGKLSAGAILKGTYLGQRHTAEVLPDGRISYAGTVYKSPSAAGGAMALAVRPPGKTSDWTPSIDGWIFWRLRDERTGDLVTLSELCRRAAQEL